MKFSLLTTLAIKITVANAVDVSALLRGAIHADSFRAGEGSIFVDTGAHCDGCQPDYCYDDEPDYDCYKNGYPKCCTKTNKGNCPNTKSDKCECEGSCNPDAIYTCKSNNDCNGDEYCRKQEGFCGNNGICVYTPLVCNLIIDEVCGCNGKTYNSECDAYAAGVSVDGYGSC